MALDVHLKRGNEETWGFEILGGTDEAPLRVDKVQPNSSADKVGLQNGDTILSINGVEAIDMKQVDARRTVAECGDSLKLGVMRGLYDPVLDDQEPIFEPYEPDASDPQSQPTEVFKIQQFIDAPEPLQFLEPPPCIFPPPFAESRSLTSSPFVLPAKPYRPFSTEPLEVPPIEDPIILNPNYKDQFGLDSEELKPDELLGSYYKDSLGKADNETKFKLPISEKYDPEGNRVKIDLNIEKTFKYIEFIEARDAVSKETVANGEVTTRNQISRTENTKKTNKDVKTSTKEKITDVKDVRKVSKHGTSEEKHSKESVDEIVQDELRYMEKMKLEIDLDKIEETALSVVEESIERAVSVAEEIKKETNEELINERRESKIATKIASEVNEIKSENDHQFIESTEDSKDPNADAQENTETLHKARKYSKSETKEYKSEQAEDTEVLDHEYYKREEEKSEMRRESRTYESDTKESEMTVQEQKLIKPTVQKEQKSYEEVNVAEEQEYIQEERVIERVIEANNATDKIEGKETKNEFRKVTESVLSDTKSDAEQRIYSIGLQTIPNIRGVVTSSYHYDLLLKTFFIHLTDVMVALSRFILTQPVFNNGKETATENKTYESGTSQVKRNVQEASKEKTMEKVIEHRPIIKERRDSKIEKVTKVQSSRVDKKEQIVKPQPVIQSKQENIQKDVKQVIVENSKVENETKQQMKTRKESIINGDAIKKDIKQEMRVENEFKEERRESRTTKDGTEVTEMRKISGASMAQLSEKKLSQDLTQKMDAVMAEFQTKATADFIDMAEVKKQMNERRRRSRSKSQVEEEVMRESDPLEWLDKVDSRRASQERTEVRKEFSSTSESYEKNKQAKRTKSPRQTYIAIVESHVYTNHDAIFEEQVSELSETSSVQSAEEINTAFEALQMETTENVAIENAVRQLETAETVVEDNYLDIASSKREATVETVSEMVHGTEDIRDYKTEQKALVKNEIQEVLVQESNEIIEPVIDIKATKLETVNVDINQSLTIAESQEINVNESKSDITNANEIKKETVSIVSEDHRQNAVKTESIADGFTELAHAQQMESKYEVIKPEYQIVEGEDITENVVIKSNNEKKYEVLDASAELKIVKKIEIESQAEIIEIEDENELVRESGVDAQSVINKLEIMKSLEIDKSQNITEKSIATSGFDSNILNDELNGMKEDSEFISQTEKSKLDQSETQTKMKQTVVTAESESSQSALSKINQSVSEVAQHSETNRASTASKFEFKSATQSDMTSDSSSFITMDDKKLALDTEIALNRQISAQSDENNNIDTPTPSTVPPTPLVDEYVFKLTIPLPKSRGSTPVPRDCTPPNEEDPHIVKKKLVPYIETTIESVLYDPPLPTPPGSKAQSPVYTKPGLRGGCDKTEYWRNRKEEIREIERKSSLLASAIDETIKSIEEYKEEVGIDFNDDVEVQEFKSKKVTKSFESSSNREVTAHSDTPQNESKFDERAEKPHDTELKESVNKIDIEQFKSEDLEPKVDESEYKIEIFESKDESEFKNKNEIIEVESTYSEHTPDAKDDTVETPNIESDSITETEKVKSTTIENKVTDSKTVEVREASTENSIVEPENLIKSVIKTVTESRATNQTGLPEVQSAENNEKSESLPGFRPVVFHPETTPKREIPYLDVPLLELKPPSQGGRQSPYLTDTGESIGTIQGIVDGLEEVVIDPEVAKELGKPGIPEEIMAELISGESEMMREAHVMGLSRVINSHMHRIDDADEDAQKIKPAIPSLKDSEVLKALNEDIARTKEQEKKKEEKKWTKFLQKPKRPVPKAMFGYHGWTAPEPEQDHIEEPYKVKIVKQPKPKVAPDYKPEDFDTGPLPWEERQLIEASLPPIEPEEPILIPEEGPEFLEAVDPLPESEVPDLEDTGIPLSPVELREPTPPVLTEELTPEVTPETEDQEEEREELVEERETEVMDNRLADQLVRSVKSMVDPNATLEQQLAQMRAQLAALAQLPEVIQETLELVTRQLSQIGKQEFSTPQTKSDNYEQDEDTQNHNGYESQEESDEVQKEVRFEAAAEESHNTNGIEEAKMVIEEIVEDQMLVEDKLMNVEHQNENKDGVKVQKVPEMLEEETRSEKQKKEQPRQPQSKQPTAPRACKPQPKFGPLDPDQRAVVLPGGRRWRRTEDVYNEQLIAETLAAQAELIQGKALGFESEHLTRDSRINFMKYEKPPVSLDHLQNSEVYKLVHNMDQSPLKRVEQRTPVMSEADYRERCRSATPSIAVQNRLEIPQQFHP